MDLNEVSDLIRMNMTLYKNSAKPLTENELEVMTSVWYWHFKDYDAKKVKRAFLAANAVCVYPIQPADIFKQLQVMQKQTEKSPIETWEIMLRTLEKIPQFLHRRKYPLVIGIDNQTGKLIESNGSKEIDELFNSLPDDAKRFFVSKNGMIEMSMFSNEELNRYRKKDFLSFCEENSEINSQKYKNILVQAKKISMIEGD